VSVPENTVLAGTTVGVAVGAVVDGAVVVGGVLVVVGVVVDGSVVDGAGVLGALEFDGPGVVTADVDRKGTVVAPDRGVTLGTRSRDVAACLVDAAVARSATAAMAAPLEAARWSAVLVPFWPSVARRESTMINAQMSARASSLEWLHRRRALMLGP
jgi:hypothetical protein